MIDYDKNIKEQLVYRWLLFCFFGFLNCFFSTFIIAQSSSQLIRKEIVVGYSIIHEQLPEGYDYTPLFFTAKLPIYQFHSNKKNKLSIFAEPQFILNNAPKTFPTTFEFGVNLGIQYILPFSDSNGLEAAIGVGPHYLSLETSLQAKGFIFSDNIEIGYYQMLSERFGVNLKSRFRHISNAGLQSPNIGIDNLFIMVGVFWKTL